VLVLIILSASALIATTDQGKNLLNDVKDKISNVVSLSGVQNQSRVQVFANLELRDFDVSYPAKMLSIDFVNPSTNIKVNSENLNLSELSYGTLALSEWSGNLNASSGGISLDGKASRLSVNSVAILPEKETLAISTNELSFSLAKLDGLSVNRFSYTSSGKVSINDGQVTANLNDETLGLKNFEGYIEITAGNMVINGTVDNIEVAGKTLSTTIT
jgi:hypothetical protein